MLNFFFEVHGMKGLQGCKRAELDRIEYRLDFIRLFLSLFEFGSGSFIIEDVRSRSARLFLRMFKIGSYSVHLN